MLRKMCLCLCVLAVCAGCKQPEPQFTANDVHFSQMAVDTAYRLQASFLPAKTSFVLVGNDSFPVFNAGLSSKLREAGFSVHEGGEMASGVVIKPNVLFIGEREAVVVMQVQDTQYERGFSMLDSGDVSPTSFWMVRRVE